MEEIVRKIQQEVKAEKTERNDFGGFDYRNIEKINASLKPIIKKYSVRLHYTDEIVNLGDRYYVKATATLTNGEEAVEATAYAREAESKTKMDEAQITGGASSYARKYAIQGLLALDDGNHDPDSKPPENAPKQATRQNSEREPSTKQKNLLVKLYHEKISTDDNYVDWLGEEYGIIAKEMTMEQASSVIEDLMAKDTINAN